LEKVRGGLSSPVELFRHVGNELHVLGMGDLEYWRYLARMSQGPHPLLHMEGFAGFPSFGGSEPSFRDCTITMTELGNRILDEKEDWLALQGIDEWFGGLRLQGRSVPWRWDETGKRAVRM
jgi:hypothetical protein